MVYTSGSEINGKIGAATMVFAQMIICKTFFDLSQYFTVYSRKLQKIAIALNIILSQTNS